MVRWRERCHEDSQERGDIEKGGGKERKERKKRKEQEEDLNKN